MKHFWHRTPTKYPNQRFVRMRPVGSVFKRRSVGHKKRFLLIVRHHDAGDAREALQPRVSGILCVRHNMAERSMVAKQEDDESGLGRGGANAVDPQRTH